MAERAPGAPAAVVCPEHGTAELVRRVSAVYHEGTGRTASAGQLVGVAGGHLMVGSVVQHGSFASSIARRLDPRPPLKAARPVLLWATVLTMLSVLIVVGDIHSIADDDTSAQQKFASVTILAGTLALAVALTWGKGLVRAVRQARVERGLARAMLVWRAGWYCGRCDGVFFTRPDPPTAAPADRLLPAEAFQHLVWSAGGYSTWGKPA